METIEDTGMKEQFIAGFVDKIIAQLNLFNPLEETTQQWSNISTARVIFNRIKAKNIALKN